MSANSKIEWTDHTFNPWIGCTEISPGCANCYAAAQDKFRRWTPEGWGGPRRRTSAANWALPMRWNAQAKAFKAQHGRRQRVFCASLADVFDNAVDPAWRVDLFKLIAATPNLDWLVLTMRIGNVRKMVPAAWLEPGGWPSHIRIGATIVNQEEADRDISKLLALPCPNFLSMEPLLGPVHLYLHLIPPSEQLRDAARFGMDRMRTRGEMLQWVIVGGESGPGARPMHPDWVRSLRDTCAGAGVPFLFKQWGEWTPGGDWYAGHAVSLPIRGLGHDGWTDDGKTCAEDGGYVVRIGKKAAGRLLDGMEWNGVPS